MSLTFYFHPLSSYCQKALVGLYELELSFVPKLVDLSNPVERAALLELWPVGKFPVLHDDARGLMVPESSIVIEYADELQAPGGRLVPRDRDRARECRLRDHFYDLYVHAPMQKIVADLLRPDDKRDPHGVAEAKAQIKNSYAIADGWMRTGTWSLGDAFTMADCSAAPALFYADKLVPFGESYPHLAAYYARLERRPSFARVLEEAKPYMALFPG
jgi:glutathione S-transferase